MKTLNEQVNEIKNAKISKNAKRLSFIKLGLRPYEISLLMSDLPKAERKTTLTFGVEIECLVSRYAIQFASDNRFKYCYENYNHNDGHDYYKFVSDGSIWGDNGIECVSPVLKGKNGLKSLELACKILNEAGARVNKSTGLHVHIGAASFTEKQYVNIFVNYKKLEKVIDSFMANSRRQNNNFYCQSLQNKPLENATSRADICEMMSNERYYKVNCMSYNRHKTVEFRQHQGSTDFKKISAWVNFLTKLCEWSKTNRLQNDIESIDEIPFLTASEKRFFNERKEALQ